MKNKIINEIKENRKYIYLSYLISILTMLPQIVASPSLSVSKHLIFLYLTLLMLFLIPKFSRILFLVFIIYINLTNIIIGHIFMHWGYNGDITSRIIVSLESPKHESLEYLMTFINYKDVLLVLYTIVTLALLYKFFVHFKHSFKIIRFLGFILFVAILLPISFYKNPIKYVEPFSIPNEYEEAKKFSLYPKLRIKYLNSLPKKPYVNKKKIYDIIVVIQGESVNKHNMSIYGYNRNTTPFFSSLRNNKNFYIFNAISPANLTRLAVPILNTKATVYNYFDAFMHSRSIVGDFKLYGYETHWISSQANSGQFDSTSSSMSAEADTVFFANLEFRNDKKTDQVLVDHLNSLKDEKTSVPQMYFIHLLGSHFAYDKRFTEDFALYKNATSIQDLYDNTIYYTDHILKNIFNHFEKKIGKDKKILFVYTADHGEFISKELEEGGHGSLSPFKDEYEVPFVMYSTIKNDRINELSNKNMKGYFNLENLNYMIEYVSGIGDKANISYSPNVMASDHTNILNYDNLKFYGSSKK